MATPSLALIQGLRAAAANIINNKPYEWGHMGNCNCGHLAQVLLKVSKADIHRSAMSRPGDWSEQLNDYCATSGFAMDQLIFGLLEKGLSSTDLQQLEYLSNQQVLTRMGVSSLKHNVRENVVAYLQTWADMLEEQLLEQLPSPVKTESLLVTQPA
jgi:adenylate kinase family enzyme